ncbi:MAG: diaminopimelate dehydrogenase [Clostridia bacterium]|nr:diaminopimelate dehydrogenase [Clostridia bacterium]
MIRIGLMGYGNLARGVESAVLTSGDMSLTAVFTRRDPSAVRTRSGTPVFSASRAGEFRDKIDVMVLCGGSATDLPEQTPLAAAMFDVVDSFDTHARIEEHFRRVDEAARGGGHAALIACGWDPGLFSMQRMLSAAVLPRGKDYTFWGRGVSQGHSDAIRRIPGVRDARQYTVPVPQSVNAVRAGDMPDLSVRQKHTRECFVVLEEGADPHAVREAIVSMPHYFSDYDTTVRFISAEEMERDHLGMPHGGFVIRSGVTGTDGEHRQLIEYSLKLDSNPEFTGSVLAACARAVYRKRRAGAVGCFTVADVTLSELSEKTGEELRRLL